MRKSKHAMVLFALVAVLGLGSGCTILGAGVGLIAGAIEGEPGEGAAKGAVIGATMDFVVLDAIVDDDDHCD